MIIRVLLLTHENENQYKLRDSGLSKGEILPFMRKRGGQFSLASLLSPEDLDGFDSF